jgi:hypothetical protein
MAYFTEYAIIVEQATAPEERNEVVNPYVLFIALRTLHLKSSIAG